ncbi:hypothetical protein H4S06_000198 [Coemansia sp. BCRC 34490]|nr:hypothetical protein H4S06_000198 [Coemansia sp. BCRC 34490]
MHRTRGISQRLKCQPADTHSPFSDKVFLPPSFLSALLDSEGGGMQELPSPITVRIAPSNACCGVRGFDAEEGTVRVPAGMLEQIDNDGAGGDNSNSMVTVEHVRLEKGEFARLRSLESEKNKERGQNEEVGNLRGLLESHMRSNLTVLFLGEIVRFPVGGRREPLSFEVVALEPASAVDIIDVDLTVDIVDSGQSTQIGGSASASASDKLALDAPQPLDIEVASGATHMMPLLIPPQADAVDIVLECNPGHDASLVASRLLRDVSEIDNDWSDCSAPSQSRKDLRVERTQLPDAACTIYVGVVVAAADATTAPAFKGKVSAVSAKRAQSSDADVSEPEDGIDGSSLVCANCRTSVPKANYDMHSLFCQRHNTRCEGCGAVLKRNSAEAASHWHCAVCSEPGVVGDEAKHNRLHHTPCVCACGGGSEEASFESALEMAEHRRTDCALRLIECRYCRLGVAQGPHAGSAEARMLGMREHEWSCGSRTITCARCNAYVRIQHVATHMQMHDFQDRQRRANMVHCANKRCDRERAAGNPLGLCAACYGPLYSNAWDPGYQKLLKRLTRMLFAQITQGCGKGGCTNREYCAAGLSESEAAARIVPIVRAYAPLANPAAAGGRPNIDYDSIDLRLCGV